VHPSLEKVLNVISAQPQNEEEETSSKEDIIIGLAESTFGFYPWWTSYDVSSISINHNIFNSLVSFDGLFRIKAELAESWNNPNNLTWRFRLKKDVKFHNGYNLTAEDVKYSIDSIKNNQTNVLRDLLLSINETKIIDNYTNTAYAALALFKLSESAYKLSEYGEALEKLSQFKTLYPENELIPEADEYIDKITRQLETVDASDES